MQGPDPALRAGSRAACASASAARAARRVPLSIAESGGYRVRFPQSGEGVLINTGGGFAGGDRMRVEADVGEGAEAVLTSQAAEKIYRSDGARDRDRNARLALGPGARLAWLPQEQILFDGAALRRRLDVEMAADASLTLVESTVFGRLAMGETVTSGAFADRWRIRRGGRLVFAEDVRLDGRSSTPSWRGGPRATARARSPPSSTSRPMRRPPRRGARRTRRTRAASAASAPLTACSLHGSCRPIPQTLARRSRPSSSNGFRGMPMPRSWQT